MGSCKCIFRDQQNMGISQFDLTAKVGTICLHHNQQCTERGQKLPSGVSNKIRAGGTKVDIQGFSKADGSNPKDRIQ